MTISKLKKTSNAQTEGMPAGKIVLIGFICVGILGAFILALMLTTKMLKKPEAKKRNFNTLAVLAQPAKLEDVKLKVKVQGEARPQTEIDLVPQVGGKIVYVSPNFIEGGIFKKGEVLIRIEAADYKTSVIRAEAAVAQAEQVLVRERAEGEIARRDFEELGSGTASALALRKPQQQQAEASLLAAKAELDAMKLQLTRTDVRAPFSGRVRTKTSDVGQFVSPGSRLGRIFSTDITEVRLALSDTDLSKLNLPIAYVAPDRASAPAVKLSANVAGQLRSWNGRIMRTDSTYDTQTRALFAIAEVYKPYGSGAAEGGIPLAPGLFVDAEIEGKTYENVVTFPRDGLRPEGEVYIVDKVGKAEIRKTSVLDTDEYRAVVNDGVAPGELVVLSPMEKSRVSMTLKVLDANDPETVLVDPPKPEWLVKREAEEKAAAEGKGKKKKTKPEGLDFRNKKVLTSIFEKDYQAILDGMSEKERKDFAKLDARGQAALMKKKLLARIEAKSGDGAPSQTNGE